MAAFVSFHNRCFPGSVLCFPKQTSVTRDIHKWPNSIPELQTPASFCWVENSQGLRDMGTSPSKASVGPQSWRRDMNSRRTAQGVERRPLSSAWLTGLAHMLRLSLIPRCRARKTFSLLWLLWLGDKTTGAVMSPTKSSLFSYSGHWWKLRKEDKQLGCFS